MQIKFKIDFMCYVITALYKPTILQLFLLRFMPSTHCNNILLQLIYRIIYIFFFFFSFCSRQFSLYFHVTEIELTYEYVSRRLVFLVREYII